MSASATQGGHNNTVLLVRREPCAYLLFPWLEPVGGQTNGASNDVRPTVIFPVTASHSPMIDTKLCCLVTGVIINLSGVVRPRLHDTTGCQTGCPTGWTTGCTAGWATDCIV